MLTGGLVRLICVTAEIPPGELVTVDDELRLRAPADRAGNDTETYLVERRTSQEWERVGDVTLAPDALSIVIAPAERRQGIARRVMLRLVDLARVLEWSELRVGDVAEGDEAARALVGGLGFVARAEDPSAFVLRLAPLGGRPRR